MKKEGTKKKGFARENVQSFPEHIHLGDQSSPVCKEVSWKKREKKQQDKYLKERSREKK